MMRVQVRARNGAFEFDTQDQERLLYGGLRSAIALPYECATGTCGTCKAKLIEGEVEDLWPDSPGKKHLNPEHGEILACQCRAKSDLTLEVRGFIGNFDPGACVPRQFTGRIAERRQLTKDVMAFSVELEEAHEFDAGQFMTVGFPGLQGARAYSMVNYARHPRRLEFVIKKVPGGGVSESLFAEHLAAGEVELFGPLGKATFHPSLDKNILCIAGGSGIAGMMSILSRAVQDNYFSQHLGHVFFGVRSPADLFYADEMATFQAQFPSQLKIVIAFSEEGEGTAALKENYPGLVFDSGFVHEVAGRHMQGAYDNVMAYLAGPPPAVDASIRMLLLQARLTTDAIRYDKFS